MPPVASNLKLRSTQRRLDSRPQSIMGIESLIPRVASLTVDCRGVNISLTKPIWKLSNDKNVRLRYFVKRNSILLLYCCDHHYDLCFTIPSLPFLNCMGHAVVFNSFINNASERRNCVLYIARLFFLTWMTLNLRVSST